MAERAAAGHDADDRFDMFRSYRCSSTSNRLSTLIDQITNSSPNANPIGSLNSTFQ